VAITLLFLLVRETLVFQFAAADLLTGSDERS